MGRKFPLGTVLSVITGKLLVPNGMDGYFDILDYMMRDNLCTNQLQRASEQCKPYLFQQYPVLDSPEMQFEVGKLVEMLLTESGQKEPDKLVLGWLSDVRSKFDLPDDMELEVEQIPVDCCVGRNPFSDLEEMVGAENIQVLDINC